MPEEFQITLARASDEELDRVRQWIERLQDNADNDMDDIGVAASDDLETVASSLERILLGYETLVANACDTSRSHLAWKPEIAQILSRLNGAWPINDLRRAFVDGAKWWEYHKTGATMWPSDRDQAEDAAQRHFAEKEQAEASTTDPAPDVGALQAENESLRATIRGVRHSLNLDEDKGVVSQCEHLQDFIDDLKAESRWRAVREARRGDTYRCRALALLAQAKKLRLAVTLSIIEKLMKRISDDFKDARLEKLERLYAAVRHTPGLRGHFALKAAMDELEKE